MSIGGQFAGEGQKLYADGEADRGAKFFDFAPSPRTKRRACHLWIADCSSRSRRQQCPRHTLLVYPDDAGFLQLRVLLLEFARNGAERSALCLREIRRPPFSLGGGVTRGGEDVLFLRHGRISCMCRVTRRLVDLRFTGTGRTTVKLRKGCGGGKQAEDEQGLFHRRVSKFRRRRGIIRRPSGGWVLLH